MKTLGVEILEEIAKRDYFIQLKSEFRMMNSNVDKFIEMMEARRKKFCEKNNIEFTSLFEEN